MGIIWRSAMPLLTTLAALVIIVNSAEEDMEAEYRHNLRARTLDTGPSSYDPPWRIGDAEPIIQQSRNTRWDEAEEEIHKHRRPGRKRKRRPQPQSEEEIVPQERYAYPEEPPRPYIDDDHDNTRQTTEMPKRRRKKPDNRPLRWTDDVVDIERPLRRRGIRRKRPSLASRPVLSEFGHTVDTAPTDEESKPVSNEQIRLDDINLDNQDRIVERPLENEHELIELRPAGIESIRKHLTEELTLRTKNDDYVQPTRNSFNQDKSLSEFSPEVMIMGPSLIETNKNEQLPLHKISHKTTGVIEPYKKVQGNSPMDPLTLKDILKRSNGTSLSEILQQHNLSLTDLLHGNQHAVSIFKTPGSIETLPRNYLSDITKYKNEDSNEAILINSETKYAAEPVTKLPAEIVTEMFTTKIEQTDGNYKEEEPTTTIQSVEKNTHKMLTRRRYPIGLRKKLRLRPTLNITYKGQLSRDLITLNSRKYSHHRRNITKSNQWKDVAQTMQNNSYYETNNTMAPETTTLTVIAEETTVIVNTETSMSSEETNTQREKLSNLDDINMDDVETTTTKEVPDKILIIEKPAVVSMPRPTAVSTGLRRQAFNNRLKKKRLKSKNSTTEAPQDDLIKNLFGMGNLVSSSEFIARTQEPITTIEDDFTTLPDLITTERTSKFTHGIDGQIKTSTTKDPPSTLKPVTKIVSSSFKPVTKAMSSTTRPVILATTAETAKIEIEEIFNDTRTSAKLSKILRERNMTLRELVEHRERGSSYVHLADIFHNVSREPNPPEPFLSKSLIEPISKETYPLRALLDANSHDPNLKGTTIQPILLGKINIPVVMDFRNNVNENAENMGIMSLFNNFTSKNNDKMPLKDSEGGTYKSSVVAVNITDENKTSNTTRESRVLSESQDDIVTWNEIFSLMGRNDKNQTSDEENTQDFIRPAKKIRLEEDADGDGLIVLEDLQHLKDFESNIAVGSDEKLEVNPFEKHESSHQSPGILDKIPNHTKSVTVATASIAGLAMILFLLTYVAFKWKQQRSMIRKKRSFDDRIPTPVFENRKGQKNNSSMRSISPMLQTSNIYTLNTLDSQNGKDSPDYMWDSLRKPFQ